jgi:hypothetical protein
MDVYVSRERERWEWERDGAKEMERERDVIAESDVPIAWIDDKEPDGSRVGVRKPQHKVVSLFRSDGKPWNRRMSWKSWLSLSYPVPDYRPFQQQPRLPRPFITPDFLALLRDPPQNEIS